MHELLRVRDLLRDASCILRLLLLLLWLLWLLPLMRFSGIAGPVSSVVVIRIFPIGACAADLAVVALCVRPAGEFKKMRRSRIKHATCDGAGQYVALVAVSSSSSGPIPNMNGHSMRAPLRTREPSPLLCGHDLRHTTCTTDANGTEANGNNIKTLAYTKIPVPFCPCSSSCPSCAGLASYRRGGRRIPWG